MEFEEEIQSTAAVLEKQVPSGRDGSGGALAIQFHTSPGQDVESRLRSVGGDEHVDVHIAGTARVGVEAKRQCPPDGVADTRIGQQSRYFDREFRPCQVLCCSRHWRFSRVQISR